MNKFLFFYFFRALKPNPLLRKSECNTSCSTDEPNIKQESLLINDLRLSKSETNLIESFAVVDKDDLSPKTKSVSPLHRLRDGISKTILLNLLIL